MPDIEQKIANGWVHVRTILEVEGNDREHVHKALSELTEKLKSENGIMVFKESYDSVKELRPAWFTLNVELELLVKGIDRLIFLVTTYPPSSLEVIAPQTLQFPASDLQSALLGISGYVNTLSNALHLQTQKLKREEEAKEKLYKDFKQLSGK